MWPSRDRALLWLRGWWATTAGGWKLGALSCCECKTSSVLASLASAVCCVRAVMLSNCCAGAPCRDMGSWARRIMWPCRDRALLWLRGWWERLKSSWLRLVRDWVSACVWDGGVATGCVEGWCDAGGSAERVCEGGDDAAASAGEGVWGSWKEEAASGRAGWSAATPTMVTLVP